MQKYYLRIEAVNLDYSVYDTYDISTIRGGSFMLHDALDDIQSRITALNLPIREPRDIGSAASVGLVAFTCELEGEALTKQVVQPVLEEVRQKVLEFGTFVWAVHKPNPSESFSETLQWLMAKCQWQQYQRLTVVPPTERNCSDPCKLDGVRPATGVAKKGGKDQPASTAVIVRREEGQKLRNNIYRQLLGESRYREILGVDANSPEEEKRRIVTDDLETLSRRNDRNRLDGKIAFIYLDGNRFTRIRNNLCQDTGKYQAFQKKVQEELREAALKKLLESALLPDNISFRTAEGKIRLETLLWGGDDIEWVVPAWQALNLLDLFFQVCQQNNADRFNKTTLTHSAGVVFCHHDLPILQIRNYAHQLCDIAKTDIPKKVPELKREHNRFAILEIVSFDYMTGRLKDFFPSYYPGANEQNFVFSAEQIPTLKTHLPIIKQFLPSTKLYALLNAFHKEGREGYKNVWERTLEVLPPWQKNRLTEAANQLGLVENPHYWYAAASLGRYLEISAKQNGGGLSS